MSRYNNNFTMQDFFCNDKLTGVVPQFDRKDTERGKLSERRIFAICRDFVSGFVGGEISGNMILVTGKSKASVLSSLTAAKAFLECMVNDSDAILSGIKENKRLYTSVASVSRAAAMQDKRQKTKLLNEILDNLNYNPDFGALNSVPSASSLSYPERQRRWKKKVGYKEKT